MIDATSGRLTVIAYTPSSREDNRPRARVRCRCECGNEVTMDVGDFRKGLTKSCGCYKRDRMASLSTRHGMAYSAEYRIWHAMINRCTHPYVNRYEQYGGRGIRVCDRWRQDFAAFYADMGPRPSPNHSVDRQDNNGYYEPGNCVWSTSREQTRNRRTTRHMTAFGKTQCVSDWASEYGIGVPTLFSRLRKGIPLEDALTIPLNHCSQLRHAQDQARNAK